MRYLTYFWLADFVLAGRGEGQTPDRYSYQILYTGRTLGYARIPDEQKLPAAVGSASPAAKEFLTQFNLAASYKAPPQFRIAMGDNFSPDLYGRSILVAPKVSVPACDSPHSTNTYSNAIHLPKDYFNYNKTKGNWYIWCDSDDNSKPLVHEPFRDNVADFLIKAKYDTVVPGKHDFYFGPGYLQQVAWYLRDQQTPVQMLAANLIIASSLAPDPLNSFPRIPERLADPCHRDTDKNHDCYRVDFGPASLDLPDNMLPWKRQFVLHGARSARDNTDPSRRLLRPDEVKNRKDDTIDYHPVFNPKSVKICSEPQIEKGTGTLGDPSAALDDGCMEMVAADEICRPGVRPAHLDSMCKAIYAESDGYYVANKQTGSTDITFLFRNPRQFLKGGLNHAFCVQPSTEFKESFRPKISDYICQPFPVQIPMFWSDPGNLRPQDGMEKCSAAPAITCPYALVDKGGFKLAIFAVVDADLLSNVGMLNDSWWNDGNLRGSAQRRKSRWDTAAQVTMPDFALLQTLDLCNSDDACRRAPKILMAQMSYARATQFLANAQFNKVFDAVVTQASKEHDTGTMKKEYQGKMPRFALTPPEPMSDDPKPQFMPLVYVATIKKDKAPLTKVRQTCLLTTPNSGPCWSVENTMQAPRVPLTDVLKIRYTAPRTNCAAAPGTSHSLQERALRFLSGQGGNVLAQPLTQTTASVTVNVEKHPRVSLAENVQAQPLTQPAASDALSQAVLLAMRNRLHTDAAMIQARDLYDADNRSLDPIPDCEVQDQISRVVWKGDEIIVLHVTGATIRKLLKQSAAFAQLDKNSLNTEIEAGRSLVTLGIYTDPADSDAVYINGAMMIDANLYTIATTDFISGGDTGYANLTPPDVLLALRVRDFANPRVRPIAGLVCAALMPLPNAKPENSVLPCADMGLEPDYFDKRTQPPPDATSGYSTRQHWRLIPRNFRMVRRPFAQSEQAVQQHPFLSLRLENGDFSETGAFIKDFHKTTTGLAGISNPLVANTGTQNIGADYKARLVYDYQKGTNYLLADMSFLYNATTSTNAMLVTSGTLALPYNVMGFEGGQTWRLPVPRFLIGLDHGTSPRFQRPSWLSAQYSVRYEREVVAPPPTLETYMPAEGLVTNLKLNTPHVNTIYGRVGLRADVADSYLEFGLEEIDARGLLANYKIDQGSAPSYVCTPATSVNLAPLACGNGSPTLIAISQLMLAGPANLTVQPNTTAYLTAGTYFNFLLKFPLWSRRDANRTNQGVYFTLTNKGDLYWREKTDTPVQTRYLDKLTPAMTVPIWAGLSLTPKVDLIAFQNKKAMALTPYHYFALQPSVSLSYTFNWREGMGWSRAFRYGAQTTTASPAGPVH
jgi:hypothetical protein